MPSKIKNTQTASDKVTELAMKAGLVLMTAAATIGMVELPHDHNNKIALAQTQPVFAESTPDKEQGSTLRREREETSPHYISYSSAQRTASRAGKA